MELVNVDYRIKPLEKPDYHSSMRLNIAILAVFPSNMDPLNPPEAK
jgi:hypothetical protein